MAKYEFTNAAGNRLIEWCLDYNKEHCFGMIPYDRLEKALWDEGDHSVHAVEKFVTWLRSVAPDSANGSGLRAANKVLGLVAGGMANELGKIQAGFDPMTRRFGVSKEDINEGTSNARNTN
jgi:hypothetical protein